MKKALLVFVCCLCFINCAKKEEKAKQERCTSNPNREKFKMYEMSEMSTLMEQMYVDNQRLKERIKNGETIGAFPNHFLEIHKAVMTDPTENDAFFKARAKEFIATQELIYKDPGNAAKHFNDGVNTCIKCHEVKCGGPISRIKKLYIK